MLTAGDKIQHIGKEYEVESITPLEVVLHRVGHSSIKIHVKVGSDRYYKIFPDEDGEVTEKGNSVTVEVQRSQFINGLEDDIEDIDESEIEDCLLHRMIVEVQESQSKKAKKQVIWNYLEESEDDEEEMIYFILWCYLERKKLFSLDYWSMLDVSRKSKAKFANKYSNNLKKLLETFVGRDEEATEEEYYNIIAEIPEQFKYVFIITICGFEWEALGLPNKDVKDILEYEEIEEL